MLDRGTYSNTPAAIVLIDIMNEQNINPKCCKLLSRFSSILSGLSKMTNQGKFELEILLYRDYKLKAEKVPIEIKTYVLNVLHYYHKNWLIANGKLN
jgi:hypothetical protein